MKKQTRNIILLFSAILWFSLSAFAQKNEIAKLTAVDRLHVSLFLIKSQNETLQRLQSQIQTALVKEFNDKSYWEAVPYFAELPAKITESDIAGLTNTKDYSGVLVGEFSSRILKIALRRFPSAKLLGVWSFPVPKNLSKEALVALLKEVVDTIVAGTPYKGFIVQKKGEQVKINLGKKQTLKKGDVLEVFELESANFESSKLSVGKIEITRVAPDAAIGEITSGKGEIDVFNKVTIGGDTLKSLPSIQKKYFDSLWLAPTAELVFIDTRISQETSELKQRQFQLTLSPFIGIAAGWRAFSARAVTGSAENASTKVNFLYSDLGYELLSRGDSRFGLITLIGGGYSQYSTSNKVGAVFPLATTSIYYPFLEQIINYGVSDRARFMGSLQLQFPKFSNDNQNGPSQISGSFGLKSGLGLRLNLSNHFSVENGITYQYSQWSLKNNTAVAEVIYGVQGSAYYRF